jgi:hypothetical protein
LAHGNRHFMIEVVLKVSAGAISAVLTKRLDVLRI